MRYVFGDFILDVETGELRRAGDVIALRRQTFRLLQLLIERAPALLARDTLLDEVWGRTALAPNAVPQAISELRRALGDDPQMPRYIETRHRRGYRFLETVQREAPAQASFAPAEPVMRANTEITLSVVRTQRPRWALLAAAAFGVAFVVACAVWLALPTRDQGSVTPPAHSIALALAELPADEGVAPWVAPAALELFGQHLAASRVRLLRSDALGLASGSQDARWQLQAHDLLAADYALGGRWRSGVAGGVALDLSLVDLASGRLVSSHHIAGNIEDLDAIVDEAGATISEALRLAPGSPREGAARPLPAQRESYWSALAMLSGGQPDVAVAKLSQLRDQLGKPAWLEPVLIEALMKAGDRDAALKMLDARLARPSPLALGERLRLQSAAAKLRHRPTDAAAALRALVELYPYDVENWIALVQNELDGLQGSAARATLATLAALPAARNDPRLSLLRSRLARLDNDFALAQREAADALGKATQYALPSLAIAASMAQADALRGEGKLDDAARLLAAADATWSTRASANVADRGAVFDLRLSQIQLLREQGHITAAESLLEQLSGGLADRISRAHAEVERALLDVGANRADQAETGLQQIKPIVDSAADPELSIAWLNAEALAAMAGNDADRAQRSFAEAFELARSSGLAGKNVTLQVNAGLVLMRQRRFVEADQQWQQALAVFESLGDRRGQATCLGNLAASASTQGQRERSSELNLRALALFRELHLPGPQARTAYNLALSAVRDGHLVQARTYYKEAGDAWTVNGQRDLILRAAVGQSEVALMSADVEAATRIVNTVPLMEDASSLSRSHVLAMRAQIELVRGDLSASRKLHEQALLLRKQDGNKGWIALSELELLRNDLLSGLDPTRVQIESEDLAQRFATLREPRDEARTWLLVADAQLSRGKIADARRSLDRVKAASESFADRSVAFDLEWAQAWLSDSAEKTLRLRSLQARASAQGYGLQAARVARVLSAAPSSAMKAATDTLPLPPYASASALEL